MLVCSLLFLFLVRIILFLLNCQLPAISMVKQNLFYQSNHNHFCHMEIVLSI